MSEQAEKLIDIIPGMDLMIKRGYTDRFFIKDKKEYAKEGDIFTVTSVRLMQTYPNIQTQSGTQLTKLLLGFKECCDECRAGDGHHEVTAALNIFHVVKYPSGSTPTVPDGPYTPARLAFQMLCECTEPWNPSQDPSGLRVHLISQTGIALEYEVVSPYNDTVPNVCITKHGEGTTYKRFPIRPEGAPQVDDRIPTTMLALLMNHHKHVKVIIQEMKEKMAKFHEIAKEVGLA
jgi:hypothetical protein